MLHRNALVLTEGKNALELENSGAFQHLFQFGTSQCTTLSQKAQVLGIQRVPREHSSYVVMLQPVTELTVE
jgi:hypothetical protein